MDKQPIVRRISLSMWAIIIKFGLKVLGPLVKFLKALKLMQVGLFAASMGAYAYIWNWRFALVFLFGLFVHELGHVWAMRREGVPHKGINFIPFLGAVVVAEKDFPSRKSEAIIGIMGPVWGGALAVVVYGIFFVTGHPLVAAIAGWLSALNLFNLLPVSPLDGGRVVKSVAFSIHTNVGRVVMLTFYVTLFVFCVTKGLALFWLIMILGLIEVVSEFITVHKFAKFESDRQQVLAYLADELHIDNGPKVVEEILAKLEDLRNYLRTVPLEQDLSHDFLELLSYKSPNSLNGDLRVPLLIELEREQLMVLIDERFHDRVDGFIFVRSFRDSIADRAEVSEFLTKVGLELFLRGGKMVMTRQQLMFAMTGYLFLVIMLATMLFHTERVEGAKHALDLFRS